ncbi:MAG: hypothetical protein AAF734_11615, partial [Bacteroidota bacterium]
MALFFKIIITIHIIAGFVSLATGLGAIITQKGGKKHLLLGKIYFMGMTVVFVTALIASSYKLNIFLFMIAFLSYYSVFAGVRVLKLKKLHKGQKAARLDWIAAGLNFAVNLVFIIVGIVFMTRGNNYFAYLSLGFGLLGCFISYRNVKPFIHPPTDKFHWWFSHLRNMMAGYIATCTAFG